VSGAVWQRVQDAARLGAQSHITGGRVLDHIYISVSNVPRSLAFYAAALKPLGWRELGSYDSSTGPAGVPDLSGLADQAYGSGAAVGSSIWLRQRHPGETGLYVGFVADDEAEVNAAYVAAIAAGGTNEGEPAIRSYFGPSYYAANVGDFDGNHLEIVHKAFNPRSRPQAE
jgi:catechol 2,3-dioxygenase-like lactoylglutathione lyase family enzyme